jgi:peptidoglycan hydrolase-like protein with peptidoglycan-binding domain
MTAYALVQPIKDNKAAFLALFKGTPYLGDIGDTSHKQGSGDHTPWSSDVIDNKHMKRGWVYAQDFGRSPAFDLRRFAPWLLSNLAAGRYREIKYIICRVGSAGRFRGVPVYGMYDRRYDWKRQASSGHDHHIHISYMPEFEGAHSRIITDYKNAIGKTPVPGAPVPIRADTYHDHRRIGVKVPNARTVRASACPRLSLGSGDIAMGGWVTYAEAKLGVRPNGYYGQEAVAAARALQKRKGLPVTGAIGTQEWNSLGQPL